MGYASASMDEIAREAQVSKATLYRYYASKESLFAAVLGELSLAQIQPPAELGPRPEATLKVLVRKILDAYCDPAYQDFLGLCIGERSRFPELAADFWERIIERGIRLMSALFEREILRGNMRKLNPSLAAQELVGTLLAFALMQSFSPRHPRKDRDQVVHQAVDVFLRGAWAYEEKRPPEM